MAFTIHDYHDLVKLLKEHPEWQRELRQLLLPDELLALPEMVQQLVRAQQNAEKRLSRLEAAVERLTEQVSALTEGQKHIIKRVDTLEEGQKELKDTVGRLEDRVGQINGRTLETSYRNKAFAYFGRLLRRTKVTELIELEDTLEEVLTSDEFNDLIPLDLLVTGKLKHVSESPEILLAVEISSVVDKNDVSRAARRANLLHKAGYQTVPAVAGEDVTRGANEAVREQNVMLVQDGQMEFWKEAVTNWTDIQLPED